MDTASKINKYAKVQFFNEVFFKKEFISCIYPSSLYNKQNVITSFVNAWLLAGEKTEL
jgi:hypothetical protein